MSKTQNMLFDTPREGFRSYRKRQYGEHRCLIFKDGQYVGMLYMNGPTRKYWRKNKYTLVMMDI